MTGTSEGQSLQGLQAALIENERAYRHGFTSTEFERQKENLLRQLESSVKEKDKTYNVIRQLIDQLQMRNLYFSEHNNQAKLSLELVATPPILFSYYFTKSGDSYSFDSIAGLDKIVHHFIKLNQLAPLSSSSNN